MEAGQWYTDRWTDPNSKYNKGKAGKGLGWKRVGTERFGAREGWSCEYEYELCTVAERTEETREEKRGRSERVVAVSVQKSGILTCGQKTDRNKQTEIERDIQRGRRGGDRGRERDKERRTKSERIETGIQTDEQNKTIDKKVRSKGKEEKEKANGSGGEEIKSPVS